MQMKPVRIVFAVMVAGRAVRQVKRLIKAIYHPDHYVFIHVDKVGANIHYMYSLIVVMSSYFIAGFPLCEKLLPRLTIIMLLLYDS